MRHFKEDRFFYHVIPGLDLNLIGLLFFCSVVISPSFFSISAVAESLTRPEIISQILVEGNYRIDSASILSAVSSRSGDSLEKVKIQEDIKSIYRLGFFEIVEADKRSDAGQIQVVFRVKERPAIKRVQFEGNDKVGTSTLKDKLNLQARKFLDRRKIQAGIRDLLGYYQEQGYYGTEIEYSVVEERPGEVVLTFKIDEGIEKVIRKIRFIGNEGIAESELSSAVSVSSYSWWISWATGSGIVKKDALDNDARILQHLYLTKGFADVRVSQPEVKDYKDGLEVIFKIDEGDKYIFGNISALGTLLDGSMQKTLEGVEVRTGEVFNVDVVRKDVFAITDKFTDIGFAFTNVDPITSINRDTKTVDISFSVDKGEKIKVGRINIIGNDKTRDSVIRRSLRVREQEWYSSSKVNRSQELLQRLGFFDEVSISPERTDRDGEVDLSVAVKEAMTGQFSAGAGVSSGDGFIVTSRISENNLMGTGNTLALDINSGRLRQNYILSFFNPQVNDSLFSFGADAAITQRDFEDFLRKQNGGSLSVGYPLWFLGEELMDDVRLSLGYELMQNEISNVREGSGQFIRDEEGRSVSSAIIPGITRSTIDNPLDPTRGSRQVLRLDYAALGGDLKYWLTQVNNSWYYPVYETSYGSFVFSQRTRLGWGEPISGERFPLFQRFFPGGINSLRGFDARRVGPRDEEGTYYGGSKQLIMNFEMIFPLIPSVGLNGVAFYDMGNAYDDDETIGFSNMRKAVGWGLRWRSPIAPIRLEFGHPLDREDGEKRMVTNFSFGAPL
ncbi:MAG TPA: outer membrane protein assembly factor BamA [Oligoflexia bacterium]|nr:outer membrane protein assembly factor BamA [Oligoflexia bacterium]HMP47072.1 outer membrane protein assembly factor BamA [Oligoflexia bacterium]